MLQRTKLECVFQKDGMHIPHTMEFLTATKNSTKGDKKNLAVTQ
jgi:hypothetical protein